MKILIISFFFPPTNNMGSVRVGKTVKQLVNLGNEVKVISGWEDSFSKDLPLEIDAKNVYYLSYFDVNKMIINYSFRKNVANFKEETSSSKKNIILSKIIDLYRYIFYTPDKFVTWYFSALKKAKQIINSWKPDIIFATAPPYTSLLVASTISRIFKIPYVAELRDLWVDNHYIKFNSLNILLEKYALSRASAIITVSEPLCEKISFKYKNPVHVIYNAFDEEDFTDNLGISVISEKPKLRKDRIIISYTGNVYYGKRDPTLLFDALSMFDDLKEKVVCNFYGIEDACFLGELVEKFCLQNNVNIYKRVPRRDSLKIQKESDILLLLLWNDPNEKGVYTGKLFEYIGSAKPIMVIGSTDNVAVSLIHKYGFGKAMNNILDVREFILNLDNNKTIIDENYRKYRYLFERKHQIKKLNEIFLSILNNSKTT